MIKKYFYIFYVNNNIFIVKMSVMILESEKKKSESSIDNNIFEDSIKSWINKIKSGIPFLQRDFTRININKNIIDFLEKKSENIHFTKIDIGGSGEYRQWYLYRTQKEEQEEIYLFSRNNNKVDSKMVCFGNFSDVQVTYKDKIYDIF